MNRLLALLARLADDLRRGVGATGATLGYAAAATWATLKAGGRLRATFAQLDSVFLGGLPLALLAGAVLGLVVWWQTHDILLRTVGPGADEFIPRFLSVAVVLELGPVGAGLLVAARTGANFGAELAAMRISEQIDALETLGQSPLRELVGPRVLACILGLPLLSILIIYTAVFASLLIEQIQGSMSYTLYLQLCLEYLRLQDAIPALLKTGVFGWLIGLVGCHYGLSAKEGTVSVGQAATASVVVSTLAVFLAEVVWVGLIQNGLVGLIESLWL